MTRLQRDFLGPFVECNGAINRPAVASALNLGAKLVAKHILYSPRVRVTDFHGASEDWHHCGDVASYREAAQTLPKAEFEHFAAMACGPEFSRDSTARALYPQMAKLYPKGIDYLGADYRAHSDLAEQLKQACYARRNAAYLAKQGGQAPTPTGPTPVRLKTVPIDDAMQKITGAPAARRRPKP